MLNQNFFRCLRHMLRLEPDCVRGALQRDFVGTATSYLRQFLGSDGVAEVVECLELFFRVLLEKTARQEIGGQVVLDRGQLLSLVSLVVAFAKRNSGSLSLAPFSLVHYCLALGCSGNLGRSLVAMHEFPLESVDFKPLFAVKEKGQRAVAEVLSAIGQLLAERQGKWSSRNLRGTCND